MRYSKYIIQDDRIIFDFYEFHFSSLKKNNILTVDRINEVDFNTYPCSMEIDNGELIFFNQDDEARIRAFTNLHKIRESKKTDTWKLLCNEFLDTAFEKTEIERNQETLRQLGFSFTELQEIRKKIKWILFGTTEWNYLGHWDLLAMKQSRNFLYRLHGRDYYWWTMKIALKGKNQCQQKLL